MTKDNLAQQACHCTINRGASMRLQVCSKLVFWRWQDGLNELYLLCKLHPHDLMCHTLVLALQSLQSPTPITNQPSLSTHTVSPTFGRPSLARDSALAEPAGKVTSHAILYHLSKNCWRRGQYSVGQWSLHDTHTTMARCHRYI